MNVLYMIMTAVGGSMVGYALQFAPTDSMIVGFVGLGIVALFSGLDD